MREETAFLLLIVFSVTLGSCNGCTVPGSNGGGGGGLVTPGTATISTETPGMPSQTEEVEFTLGREDNGSTFRLERRQFFGVDLGLDTEFELEFDDQYLELVSPQEDPSRPGPAGWVFSAVRAGTTALEITSKPPTGDEGSGAPALIFRITLNIEESGLVLERQDSGGTFQVDQGEEFVIDLNMRTIFELRYEQEYLELVSLVEHLENPGAGKWIFKALNPGTTELKIISQPSGRGEGGGAPAYLFQVTIKISE